MNSGPLKLNIPLNRRNYLPYWIIAGCIVCTLVVGFFSIDFAIAFFSSSIVGLPMLLSIVLPSKGRSLFSSWGVLGSLAAYILIFGYIALAKTIFVPALIDLMRYAMP